MDHEIITHHQHLLHGTLNHTDGINQIIEISDDEKIHQIQIVIDSDHVLQITMCQILWNGRQQ